MFGLETDNRTQNSFTLINFDADLLGSYFNARTVTRTVAAIQNAPATIERGPAVITPWDQTEGADDRTLAGKFNAVRGKTDFIDLGEKSIRETRDKDEKALFALYQALNDLKTVADYAAEPTTPTALLSKLNSQFRGGLGQVEDYVREADLDKLTLMFGEKKPRVESEIGLGKNNYDITGAALSVSSKTAVIPGLAGTEVFTLNLGKSLASDDFVMDLSQITEPLSLTGLASYFNQQIIALTTIDSSGNEVSKYGSRFVVEEVSPGKFALGLDVLSTETVTLTAQAAEPALYITGSHRDVGSGQTETGSLTKLRDLAATGPVSEFSREVAGADLGSVLPPLTDDDGAEIATDPEVMATRPAATVADSQGNVYVVGATEGDFDSQINVAATQDVFLTKHDAAGNVLWSRLLGASDQAEAFDVVVDANDNVVIAGQVNDELVTDDIFSGFDSFVTKFDAAGEELWTYQQDTVARDQANSLAIDANGDVIVTGSISGALNATTTHGGASDIYVARLGGADGALAAATQIGGAGIETGAAVALAGDGNILVASRESGRAVIRKLDAADMSNELASYDLGDLAGGVISDMAVDASGAIYVAGLSYNASLSGGATVSAHSGGGDGFVTRLSDSGTALAADWTHYLGSAGADRIEGLSAQNGAVYVAGKTDGALPGAAKSGVTDGFAAKIDAASGTADWIRQFGGTGYNGASSLAFSAAGSSVLTKLGLPTGTYDNKQTHDIETQTSARAGDYFYVAINGGRAQKIMIKADDDFTTLAKRIRRLSFRYIKAEQTIGDNGPGLKIESLNGSTLDVIAGDGARDALVKLGMQPSKILPTEKVFAIGDEVIGTDPDNLGGVFGLDLLSGFSLRSKKEAEYVSSQLDAAMETVKRAFRSLTYDPVKADILKQSELEKGVAPLYLQKQLANYQDGLNRLSLISGDGGFSI